MTATTFDTLEFVKTLEAKGFKKDQAEGLSDAMKQAFNSSDIATRNDIKVMIQDAELRIIRWNIGTVFAAAGLAAAIVKMISP
ncbi:MAG: CCDC90 family protein [Zoogloeaceae bacterium]|nr:CCDC90 family protein [Zoogloeaceae bacterium]